MCKIKDMLQKKGPVFNVVTPDTKVVEALNIMKSENLSYVVVMQDGNYLGITLPITATSREQLDELYRTLSTHPLVSIVL
jgi:putative lipoic acid-binding regulatory protein